MAEDIKKPDELLDEVQEHLKESDTFLETIRGDWDDLESMLISKVNDSLSKSTNNSIFDPILSTIVYERVSRVMAQNPKGKAYAQSKDDIGKNMLMNLLLKYYYKNATEQESMLIKLRLWDLYSLVYGSMFALIPWRNSKDGYTGPELNIIPIRHAFPQPSRANTTDMDWFTVRNVVSIDWLKKQDPDGWDMKSIDDLDKQLKEGKSGGDETSLESDERKSFIEKSFFPSTYSDVAYPQVELYTEYRRDKWVTWAPQRIDSKTSHPMILRNAENPYPDYMLPVVAKHAFPLIDSPIGFGEFARGRSLQMGINSLWNLYLQGVKYSIYPPLHINPDNVVPSSIKWGEGEFWFMNTPNQDVQAMRMSPAGLDTFNSTFGAMKSAIESQAGTTSVRESANTKSGLGKTPQAIQFLSEKEGARDEWDRVMMEQSIEQVYTRWIALTVSKMSEEVQVRLFGDEIEDIKGTFPDVVEMFASGKRANAKIKKKDIDGKYDFILETGSTTKPDIEDEQNNLTAILKAVLENPTIMESLSAEGKMVNIPELFKRWLIAGGIKDYDRIVTDMPQPEEPAPEQMQEQMPQDMGQLPPDVAQMQQPMPQQMDPMQQMQQPGLSPEQFQDPDIQAAVAQLMGNIPTQYAQ